MLQGNENKPNNYIAVKVTKDQFCSGTVYIKIKCHNKQYYACGKFYNFSRIAQNVPILLYDRLDLVPTHSI